MNTTYPMIIGIRGKKEAGKDYAYACIFHLLAGCAIEVYRRGFADKLKEEVAEAYKCPVQFINDNKKEFRLILQGWGSSKRRLVAKNYWVSNWLQYVQSFQSMKPSAIVVCPDVRHKNELEVFESNDWPVIQIVAINKPECEELDTHESECELDSVPCKIILQNDFTDKKKLYNDLRVQLKKLGYPII